MILRLLFVLLSALNIAVAAWVWLGQPYAPQVAPVTDPGVPALQLLSELPASGPAAAPLATAGDGITTTSALRCLALGPFTTPQDLRSARQVLTAQALRMRSRQEQVAHNSNWWVYLPPAASRAQALESARRLRARNIGDYFVVSVGEQPNSVSLGVFKDPANARRRRDEVAAAGFPARMLERPENVPEYWLDVVVADAAQFNWGAVRATAIRAHSIACF